MERSLRTKISTLSPEVRDKIEGAFKNLNLSISLLYDMATLDEKTGLYNNRFFTAELDIEFEKAKRNKQKLCLMIIDIDFFKKINDVYGHIKADEILKRLAQVIKKQIRKSDIAARFGGEEFFILLTGTDLKKAKKLSTRLKNSIHSDSMLKKYKVTVSAGVAQFIKTDSKKTFKQRADKALYEAKKTGRDKFVFTR